MAWAWACPLRTGGIPPSHQIWRRRERQRRRWHGTKEKCQYILPSRFPQTCNTLNRKAKPTRSLMCISIASCPHCRTSWPSENVVQSCGEEPTTSQCSRTKITESGQQRGGCYLRGHRRGRWQNHPEWRSCRLGRRRNPLYKEARNCGSPIYKMRNVWSDGCSSSDWCNWERPDDRKLSGGSKFVH